jgi:hypothetical protein
MHRALILAVLLLGAFAVPAVAANDPRIVNGTTAGASEFPSQGFLLFQVGPDLFSCGGTLVAPRKFLTAAHCTVDDFNQPLPPENFNVYLGNTKVSVLRSGDPFFVDQVDVHPHYAEDASGHGNDVAMLTLDRIAPFDTTRVIKPGETALWAPNVNATIIGWGDTSEGGTSSNDLLKAQVPIRDDSVCSSALSYGTDFAPATMVCAGNPNGTTSSDTCQGDSGGPLLVPDGSAFVLTGVVSWGNGCNEPGFPGIYSRVGAPALNAWVRGRLYDVDFTVSVPQASTPTSFAATAPGSSGFSWDFDGNGTIDATGASVSHTYPAAGSFEPVLSVTDPEGQPAEQRHTISVGNPPPPLVVPPPPVTPSVGNGPAPQPTAVIQTQLATILALGKPKVRAGRFKLRINFAQDAPAGIAVIEVFRGKKKIGSARAAVRRGGSRQVSVKLNKTGKRLLRKSKSKRLKVKVQVRVKRQVLRSKTLTLRR